MAGRGEPIRSLASRRPLRESLVQESRDRLDEHCRLFEQAQMFQPLDNNGLRTVNFACDRVRHCWRAAAVIFTGHHQG